MLLFVSWDRSKTISSQRQQQLLLQPIINVLHWQKLSFIVLFHRLSAVNKHSDLQK